MKLFTLILLFLSLISFNLYAQRSGLNSNNINANQLLSSYEANLTYQSGEEFYNPWKIHKKVSGFGLLGTWTGTIIGSLAMDDQTFSTTFIPVAGPFVSIVKIQNDRFLYFMDGGKSLLIAAGVSQSAFLTYYIISAIGKANYQGKHLNKSVTVAPLIKGVGISMNVNF